MNFYNKTPIAFCRKLYKIAISYDFRLKFVLSKLMRVTLEEYYIKWTKN